MNSARAHLLADDQLVCCLLWFASSAAAPVLARITRTILLGLVISKSHVTQAITNFMLLPLLIAASGFKTNLPKIILERSFHLEMKPHYKQFKKIETILD